MVSSTDSADPSDAEGALAAFRRIAADRLPARYARALAASFVPLAVATLPTAAQSAAGEAAGAAEDAGLCAIITLALGFIVLLLIVVGGARGGLAFQNLGAASPEKKKQGREQLVGAGVTFAGVFFFSMFGWALDTAGLAGVSCVNWNNILPVVLF